MKSLEQLKCSIKSGEYSGADLMEVLCHIDNLVTKLNTQETLIKKLYNGLQNYYVYSNNLEDAIFECGDAIEEEVFSKMPSQEADNFNHKDCRFLLAEVKDYLKG